MWWSPISHSASTGRSGLPDHIARRARVIVGTLGPFTASEDPSEKSLSLQQLCDRNEPWRSRACGVFRVRDAMHVEPWRWCAARPADGPGPQCMFTYMLVLAYGFAFLATASWLHWVSVPGSGQASLPASRASAPALVSFATGKRKAAGRPARSKDGAHLRTA